jgi:predicted HTH domain antitoxin
MLWQIKQLEKLSEVNPGLVDSVLDRLLEEDPALQEKLVVGAYLDGDINIGKAAELLGVHPVELRQRFLKRGIPVRIGAESVEELRAEVAAAEGIGQTR